MFAKFRNTRLLMAASWRVLRRTNSLAIFPLLSGIACMLVSASFIVPIVLTGVWQPPKNGDHDHQILYYALLFAFYFCNYAVITFFNVAIVSGAVQSMSGASSSQPAPTVGGCLREAMSRLPAILGWAAVSATVGLVLRLIEDRSPKVGQFVAGLLGLAWTFASFLVVPALVVDNLGPIAALKQSSLLLRRTWGENLVGNFSFGLIFFLLMLPAWIAIGLGVYAIVATHNMILGGALIGLAIVFVIALALVQSTLQSIFQAAVYLYTKGSPEHGFPAELMAQAIRGDKPTA